MSELIKVIGWVEEFEALEREQIEIKREIKVKEKEIKQRTKIIGDETNKFLPLGLTFKARKEMALANDKIRKLDDEVKQLKKIKNVGHNSLSAKIRRKRQVDIELSTFFEKHNPSLSDNSAEKKLLNEINKTLKQSEINKIKDKVKTGKEKEIEDKVKTQNFLTPYLVRQLRLYKGHFEQQIREEKENSQELVKNLEKVIDDSIEIENENVRLVDENKKLKKQNRQLQKQFSQLEFDYTDLGDAYNLLEETFKKHVKEYNEKLTEIDKLKKDLEKKDRRHQRLLKMRDALVQELKELKEQDDSLYTIYGKTKNRLNNQNGNIRNLVRDKKWNEAEIIRLKKWITSLKEDKQDLEKTLKDKKGKIRELKNSKIKTERDLNLEIGLLKQKIERLNNWLEVRTDQRDRARTKLKVLKDKQWELKTEAQSKKVCLSLIRHENISNRFLAANDNSLTKAIEDTSKSLVDVIAKAQKHLGVDDLKDIETAHKMPEGINLQRLIDFWNDPPTSTPVYVEKPVEVPVEVPIEVPKITRKPAIKKVEKIVETPFGEDLQVIKELEIDCLEQLFPNQLETSFLEQIKSAQNYKQLTQIRNEFLAKHLNGEAKKTSETVETSTGNNIEKWLWVSSLTVSLIVIIMLLIRLKGYQKFNKKKLSRPNPKDSG